jgi:hypothetical protein
MLPFVIVVRPKPFPLPPGRTVMVFPPPLQLNVTCPPVREGTRYEEVSFYSSTSMHAVTWHFTIEPQVRNLRHSAEVTVRPRAGLCSPDRLGQGE